ncbi:cGMP-dependent kinase [Tanacetum coccineum]
MNAGTTTLHSGLEKVVADFVGKPAALVAGMGYVTNSTILPVLMGKWKADPMALRLLEKLIAFDPLELISAKEISFSLGRSYSYGLANLETKPPKQLISKLEFKFERRRLKKNDVRELIYRKILEYHPQMLQEYLHSEEYEIFSDLEEQEGKVGKKISASKALHIVAKDEVMHPFHDIISTLPVTRLAIHKREFPLQTTKDPKKKIILWSVGGGDGGGGGSGDADNSVDDREKVRIQIFLEKSKNCPKKVLTQAQPDETKDNDMLRKRVQTLIKRKRIMEVQKILKIKEYIPWSRDKQAKLGCRLIELLMDVDYVQSPVSQSDDAPPDIRPAFRHIFKIITMELG